LRFEKSRKKTFFRNVSNTLLKNSVPYYIALLGLSLLVCNTSCISYKDLLILNKEKKYPTNSLYEIENAPPNIIQPDDRLLIKVATYDEEQAQPFMQQSFVRMGGRGGVGGRGGNQFGGGRGGQGGLLNNPNFLGYLVDPEGDIEFPVIGTIKVAGLTINQAKDKLYTILDEYLVNYSVDLLFTNRRIVVSGEVRNPGIVQLDRNRITIIEALEKAGGLTTFSERSEVYMVRELKNERIFTKLDLQDRNIVDSEFYYVYPNDVIFVKPAKSKTFTEQTSFFRALGIVSSAISLVSVILVLTNR